MTAVYPAGNNTFVPDHEASGKMVVDFSRNPNSFALNNYSQLVPTDRTVGYYLNMTVEEAGRLLSAEGEEFFWGDGADEPDALEGTESFEFLPFLCKRRSYRARIGDMAAEQASWDIIGRHAAIKAQQAMTTRTSSVVTAMTTSGNYPAANTATTTVAGGGQWDAATTANLFIKKSIDYAVNIIMQSTLGAVSQDDLVLVVSPTLAKEMAEAQEIVDYLKGSPAALAYVKGEVAGDNKRNKRFGLPEFYAGVKIEVEDAVKVTSKKGATRATSYVMPSDKPAIVSRPGGLVGVAGAPSFSTVSHFVWKENELLVEVLKDVNNKRTIVRVVDTFHGVVTAGLSGFLFTGAT